MPAYPLIAAKLYTEPWCIKPSVHATICAQFRAHAGLAPRAAADDPVGPFDPYGYAFHPQVETHAGIAYVPITGVIGKHLSILEMECGGYDIGLLHRQLENIANDPTVKAAVLHFNTPGGVGIGVGGAAKAIRALAESGVKVYGYTDYECCSAGYWMAAACDEFHAEESAVVGSISTFIAAMDSHRAFEMEGLELKLFRTGEIKAIGMPGKQWTAEEEAFLSDYCRKCDEPFKQFVLTRRGMDPAVLDGSFWKAADAPSGIVDSTAFPTVSALLESVYQTL